MANHGSAVRRIVDRYGIHKVEEFVDVVCRSENLIDPWSRFVVRRRESQNRRRAEQVEVPRLKSKDYMDGVHHPSETSKAEEERWRPKRELEKANSAQREQDVLLFLLEKRRSSVGACDLSIHSRRGLLLRPQMQTKIMNEGWASYWHSK